MILVILLTKSASMQLSPERDEPVPSLWIDADEPGNELVRKRIPYHRVVVNVSLKQLVIVEIILALISIGLNFNFLLIIIFYEFLLNYRTF